MWVKIYEKQMDVPVPEQDIRQIAGNLLAEIGPSRDGYTEIKLSGSYQQNKEVCKQFKQAGYETSLD